MKGIIERFEGEIVVIEIEGDIRNISIHEVDRCAKTGDVVNFVNGKWVTNEEETYYRIKKIKGLMNNVWED